MTYIVPGLRNRVFTMLLVVVLEVMRSVAMLLAMLTNILVIYSITWIMLVDQSVPCTP